MGGANVLGSAKNVFDHKGVLVTDKLDVTSVEQNKGLHAVSHSKALAFICFKIDG